MVLPKPKRGRKKNRKNTRKLISFDIAFFGLKYHLSYALFSSKQIISKACVNAMEIVIQEFDE